MEGLYSSEGEYPEEYPEEEEGEYPEEYPEEEEGEYPEEYPEEEEGLMRSVEDMEDSEIVEELDIADPFGFLPEETIEELCFKLDTKALGRFMTTSRRNKRVCKRVYLERRKIFLSSKLIGEWKRCFDAGKRFLIEDVTITDNDDLINIESNPFPIDELEITMKKQENESYQGSIDKSLQNLKYLLLKFKEIGFIKINPNDSWIGDINERIVLYYPDGSFKTLGWMSMGELREIAKEFNIKSIMNKSKSKIVNMIVNEFKKRDKYVGCGYLM